MKWTTLLLGLAAATMGIGIGTGYYVIVQVQCLPDIANLESYEPPKITSVYSADSRLIGEFFREKRIPLEADQIPQIFRNAILAAEDTSFEEHPGIDLKGIMRALLRDIQKGQWAEGGSTITQQLAKTLFLTPERNFSRKLKEFLLAVRIERAYTKDEILKLYINQIYFGHGAYGAEAAATIFFSKSLAECEAHHYAMLAALPKAPALYSPYNHADRCLTRRNYVLQRMQDLGFIDQATYDSAVGRDLEVVRAGSVESPAPYFLAEVRKKLESRFGSDALYTSGYRVITSLSVEWQQLAQQAVNEGIAELVKRHKLSTANPAQHPQAALLAMNPRTGEIYAMVGGRSYEESQFNRTTQARRQVGSAIKPIIYLAAMESGLTPASTITDAPITYRDPWTKREWSPRNYTRRYEGKVTLLQSMEDSINISAVKLLDRLGIETVIETARRLGITSEIAPYLSIALGTPEVSLLEMVTAYSAFANQGIRPSPYLISHVYDSTGREKWSNPQLAVEATDQVSAFLVTQMMQAVMQQGTAASARSLRRTVAGKTGTTDEYTDAWFIGFTPDLVTGVWIGYDYTKSLGPGETGGKAALPIWLAFMARALKDQADIVFEQPANLREVTICRDSGELATSACRETFRVFLPPDKIPALECKLHLGS